MKNFINTFIVFVLIALAMANFEKAKDYSKNIKSIKEVFIPENLGRILAQIAMFMIFIYAAYEIWN